jgi:lysophospholipase L1-like esterase
VRVRLRQRQAEVLLILASTAVVLCGAELAARLAWKPVHEQPVIRPDPLYGWSLRPGSRLHSVASDRGLDYRIAVNSLGLRDRERSIARGGDLRRVLFVGDSMVFGAGVEREERLTERLEALLGPGVEVWNGGVSGWGTDQEALWLWREGLPQLQPDVVVLGLCVLNDILNVMLPHELFGAAPKPRFVLEDGRLVLQPPAPRPRPTFGQRAAAFAKHSRLLHFAGQRGRLLRHRIAAPRPKPAAQTPYYPEDLDADTSHWAVFRVPLTPRFEAAFQVTEALITGLRDSCAARGVPLVLFAWPQKVEIDSQARALELRHYGYDPAWFDLEAPYVRLGRLADRLGVPFLHPRAAFERDAARTPLFFQRDGHPNAAGHAAAAAALEPTLRDVLHELEAGTRITTRDG